MLEGGVPLSVVAPILGWSARTEADNATQLIPRDNARDNTVRSVQAPTCPLVRISPGKSADDQHQAQSDIPVREDEDLPRELALPVEAGCTGMKRDGSRGSLLEIDMAER